MDVYEAAFKAAKDLDSLGVPYALIGGLAVSVRSEPRFTRDVDWAVAVPDDEAAERLARQMTTCGYRLATIIENTAQDRLATVRLELPGDRLLVDMLFASSGIEPEIVAAAERVEVVPGWWLPVARTGHLIALKLLAQDDERRGQDRIDLQWLLGAADDDEIALAGEAVGLIEERGYARGRDLRGDLDVWVAKHR